MDLLGYIAKRDRSILKFEISNGEKAFFRNIVEYGLAKEAFSATDIEGYLKKRLTHEEIVRDIPKRQGMAYKNVHEYFCQLRKAQLIERASGVILRHPREQPHKISPIGWLYFWSELANSMRSYREILIDRFDRDPIIATFVRPFFEKQTVQSLIHDIYVINDYLSPGPFPGFLRRGCRNLITNFLNSAYSETTFKMWIRNYAKEFIIFQIRYLGSEPALINLIGDRKIDKSAMKYTKKLIQDELEDRHRNGAIFACDEKFMTLFEELQTEFEMGANYLRRSREEELAASKLADVNAG